MNRSIDSLSVRRNAYRHKGVVARRKDAVIVDVDVDVAVAVGFPRGKPTFGGQTYGFQGIWSGFLLPQTFPVPSRELLGD